MGRDIDQGPPWVREEHQDLQMITLQVWQQTGHAHLLLTGLYETKDGPRRRSLGSAVVKTDLIGLPSVAQTAYGAFQEALKHWRELTTPKD